MRSRAPSVDNPKSNHHTRELRQRGASKWSVSEASSGAPRIKGHNSGASVRGEGTEVGPTAAFTRRAPIADSGCESARDSGHEARFQVLAAHRRATIPHAAASFRNLVPSTIQKRLPSWDTPVD